VLLAASYMIAYIPVNFPSCWALDKLGLKWGVGIGVILTGIFGFLRGIFAANFIMVVICQIMCAIGQPFILNSFTKMASTWFPLSEKAIASGKRSVELQPNGAGFHADLGSTLSYAGRVDEAIAHIKQAIRLNPFPPFYYYQYLSRCYLQMGQYEDALAEYRKALQRAPDNPANHLSIAITYALLDREEEARASAAKALELNPNFSVSWYSKISKHKDQAFAKHVVDAMRKAGFPE